MSKKFFNNYLNPASGLFIQKSSSKSKARSSSRSESLVSMAERIYEEYGTRNARDIWRKELLSSHCSVLVKLLKDDQNKIKDVLMAHATWDDFRGMLKVMKRYNFSVPQEDPSKEKIHYNILFPTYPGCLTSQDDYYVRENGVLVTETTLEVYNSRLFSAISLQDFIPSFLKLATANFLGDTATNWVKYFSLITTDVYSSEWMILDINNLERSIGQKTLEPETFYVVEKIPGTVESRDMSSHLSTETFWASYNLPVFPDIDKQSGNYALYDSSGLLQLTESQNGRGKILREMQENVENLDDMKELIRLNRANEEDGVTDPDEQIAARLDLRNDNYQRSTYGATDAKIAGLELAKEVSLWGISGPTTSGHKLKPFKFEESMYEQLEGIPEEWNFEWRIF